MYLLVHAVVQFAEALSYESEGLCSISDGVIGRIFHRYNRSGLAVAPGVDSASNRNKYHECFKGGVKV